MQSGQAVVVVAHGGLWGAQGRSYSLHQNLLRIRWAAAQISPAEAERLVKSPCRVKKISCTTALRIVNCCCSTLVYDHVGV